MSKINELEKKLNKEYKYVGSISIKELHSDTINISDIKYIESIIKEIEPLDVSEPIIIANRYYNNGYKLIDGYHRLKSHINSGNKDIPVIILDNYNITRKNDTLFDFLSQLVDKNIKFIDDNTLLADGNYYQIIENEGCGGCSNGWSSITVLPEFIGKTIKIKNIKQADSDNDYDDTYELIINDKKVADVDTGWGNGYYGGDFKVELVG